MRETKTAAEIEALIFERLRTMPGGEYIEGVSVYVDKVDGLEPTVGVGWAGDIDAGPFLREASRSFAQFRRDYDLRAS